jgi:predicted transcriptional regulator
MQLDPTDRSVLQIICQIVKEHSQPLKYQLHPRELILRSREDWNVIQSSLMVLENEGAIVTRGNLDNLQISLTAHGLKMCGTSKTV